MKKISSESWREKPLTCGAMEDLLQPFYDKLKVLDNILYAIQDVRESLDSLSCQLIADEDEESEKEPA